MGALVKAKNQLPYLKFLLKKLQQQSKQATTLFTSNFNGETWYWLQLGSDIDKTAIGFSRARIGTKPFLIIAPTVIMIFLLPMRYVLLTNGF